MILPNPGHEVPPLDDGVCELLGDVETLNETLGDGETLDETLGDGLGDGEGADWSASAGGAASPLPKPFVYLTFDQSTLDTS